VLIFENRLALPGGRSSGLAITSVVCHCRYFFWSESVQFRIDKLPESIERREDTVAAACRAAGLLGQHEYVHVATVVLLAPFPSVLDRLRSVHQHTPYIRVTYLISTYLRYRYATCIQHSL